MSYRDQGFGLESDSNIPLIIVNNIPLKWNRAYLPAHISEEFIPDQIICRATLILSVP